MIPLFQSDGLLPPGDYEVSLAGLRQSILALGNPNTTAQGTWDTAWRTVLIDNLEVLTRQLWQVGIQEIYVDGSFAEDKDHPNDIDGQLCRTPRECGWALPVVVVAQDDGRRSRACADGPQQ